MPCLIVVSGLIIRYAMAQISGQTLVQSDIANIAVKELGWAFFVGALGFATASLEGVEHPVWEPWELVYSSVCAVIGMISAGLMFRRLQHLFAEYV